MFCFISQRLQAKIIKIVDVSYGGENGFNQAIELASEALANVKFIQEKKLIGENFSMQLLAPIIVFFSLAAESYTRRPVMKVIQSIIISNC